MNQAPHPLRSAVAAAVLCATGLAAGQAMAALPGQAERQQIEQTYRAERAACLDGSTTQERSACLAEARAVRKEALRGELGVLHDGGSARAEPSAADLLANALLRCDAVPADVRNDCARRVQGEGTVVGSVAEGGILRELPAAPATAVLAPSPQPQPEAPLAATAQPANPADAAADTVVAMPADTAAAMPADAAAAMPADRSAAMQDDSDAAAPADTSVGMPADSSAAATADDLAARPADAMTDVAAPAPGATAEPAAQPQR